MSTAERPWCGGRARYGERKRRAVYIVGRCAAAGHDGQGCGACGRFTCTVRSIQWIWRGANDWWWWRMTEMEVEVEVGINCVVDLKCEIRLQVGVEVEIWNWRDVRVDVGLVVRCFGRF